MYLFAGRRYNKNGTHGMAGIRGAFRFYVSCAFSKAIIPKNDQGVYYEHSFYYEQRSLRLC